jgi:hypothetical protein
LRDLNPYNDTSIGKERLWYPRYPMGIEVYDKID